jgi:hypothetical protein
MFMLAGAVGAKDGSRVETKIFVFAFSRKFISIFAKISEQKLTKIAKVVAQMQNLLISPHILIF